MKTYLVRVADARPQDDIDFLALFIPSIATTFQRSGPCSWTVSSVLTAGQIRDRLRRWTAGHAPVVDELDAEPSAHLVKAEFWRHGAMFTLDPDAGTASQYERAAA